MRAKEKLNSAARSYEEPSTHTSATTRSTRIVKSPLAAPEARNNLVTPSDRSTKNARGNFAKRAVLRRNCRRRPRAARGACERLVTNSSRISLLYAANTHRRDERVQGHSVALTSGHEFVSVHTCHTTPRVERTAGARIRLASASHLMLRSALARRKHLSQRHSGERLPCWSTTNITRQP